MSDEKYKAMLDNAPLLGYIWVVIMATWGGTVGYMRKLKRKRLKFSWGEFALEIFISAFSGLVTAYVCIWAGMPFPFVAAASGVAGHMGGAAIDLFEHKFRERMK